MLKQKIELAVILSGVLLVVSSCAPEIKLTASWANREAKVKSQPLIMVIALGKANSTIRQDVENKIVEKLKKEGCKAVPGSDLLKPEIKHDSAEVVSILRKNNIDMLLTNAVVKVTEKERFIQGAVQGPSMQINDARYGSPYYSNYYFYYDSYRTIDPPATPGVTVADVEVVIESRLYQVATPELIWYGQSMIYTKEPSKKLINAFAKTAVDEIKRNKLLVK